jgi:hypothetical protein
VGAVAGEHPAGQRGQQGPAAGATTEHTTSIDIGNLAQSYLPLPYPARTVSVPGTWLYDSSTLNVVGRNRTTRDLSYSVQHLVVQPTPQQLDDALPPTASLGTMRTLPPDLPPSILRTCTSPRRWR